jgi:hypothetical protein
MRPFAAPLVRAVSLAFALVVPACDPVIIDRSGDPSGAGGGPAGTSGVFASGTSVTSTTATTSSGAGGSSSGDCGDFSFNPQVPDCEPCAHAHCCVETAACNQRSDCWALLQCQGACLDQACVDACEAQFPFGAAPLDAFMGCAEAACSAECGLEICPDNAIKHPPRAGLQACNDCIGTSCCPEYTALSAPCLAGDQAQCDAAVLALDTCLADLSDPACAGHPLAQAAATCSSQQCADLCPTPICGSGFTIQPMGCAQCLGACGCDAFTQCYDDDNCKTCLINGGQQGTNCDAEQDYLAARACLEVTCADECG